MKKLLFFLLSVMIMSTLQAQVKSGDAELDKRLAAYMQANEDKDFETVMEYMHPNLFKLAPKEAILASMKSVFESGEMEIKMSDLGITSAETKSFVFAGIQYRKVFYKMTISMKFTDTSVYNPEFIDMMTETFKASFEGKKVSFDQNTRSFIISGTDILYAIKDGGKEWLFLGFKNDPDMIKKLFPKEVADHYKMMD